MATAGDSLSEERLHQQAVVVAYDLDGPGLRASFGDTDHVRVGDDGSLSVHGTQPSKSRAVDTLVSFCCDTGCTIST